MEAAMQWLHTRNSKGAIVKDTEGVREEGLVQVYKESQVAKSHSSSQEWKNLTFYPERDGSYLRGCAEEHHCLSFKAILSGF